MPSFKLEDLNYTNYASLEEFFQVVMGKYFILAVSIVAIVFLIQAGFMYLTSKGDEKKTGEAQKTILNVIIGLAIIFLAPFIVTFVMSIIQGTGN